MASEFKPQRCPCKQLLSSLGGPGVLLAGPRPAQTGSAQGGPGAEHTGRSSPSPPHISPSNRAGPTLSPHTPRPPPHLPAHRLEPPPHVQLRHTRFFPKSPGSAPNPPESALRMGGGGSRHTHSPAGKVLRVQDYGSPRRVPHPASPSPRSQFCVPLRSSNPPSPTGVRESRAAPGTQ